MYKLKQKIKQKQGFNPKPQKKKNSIPNNFNKFTHLQLSQPNPRLKNKITRKRSAEDINLI
jgi:hypothetical protein